MRLKRLHPSREAATGSNSFNSRDPKIGVPTFFLIFQSKNFLLQKTFLIFVIQTKG
jgi:hypothetical protein